MRNYNPLTRSETQGIRLWLRKNKAIKKEEEALVFEALQRLAKEARINSSDDEETDNEDDSDNEMKITYRRVSRRVAM